MSSLGFWGHSEVYRYFAGAPAPLWGPCARNIPPQYPMADPWSRGSAAPRRSPVRGSMPMALANPMCLLNLASLRSEEHTSELQSRFDLVCRLLLEKTKRVFFAFS